MPTMTLTLNELDYATIQKEIAEHQRVARSIGMATRDIIADGESCLAGALIAEALRDLVEYRQIWEVSNPPTPWDE
jgi:hypothetical protein